MLTRIAIEPFKKTNARGTDIGLRVAWISDRLDDEVFISYQLNDGPFTTGASQTVSPFVILPAEPGRYTFRAISSAPGQMSNDYGFREYVFDGLLDAEEDIPRPTGLELVGVDGALLGSARTFTGRDLRIRWNSLRADALQTEGLGEQAADGLLEHAVISVYSGDTLLRSEVQPISLTEWIYTYADATEDIPLTADPASVVRDLRLEVVFRDSSGRESVASALQIEWTLRLSATADLDVGATQEFATFTKSSAFAVLNVDDETETYGPASMQVFDASAVVRALIRINFDLLCTFPNFGDSTDVNTKNQVIFEVLRRLSGGGDTIIDTFQYDMHITYPESGFIPGRISIPSFSVYDTPGAGLFEYRVRISVNIAQGGASVSPTLMFQGVLLNLEVQQAKR